MADMDENGIYAACTTLKECEDMFAPKKSKANEHNDQIISTDNQLDISLQNQDNVMNPAEEISGIAEKGPEEAQSALIPVPEPNPSPAEKISGIAEKGPEEAQSALIPVPEPNPSPAEKIRGIAEKGPEEAQSALIPVPEPNPSPAEKISGIAEKGPEVVQSALMQVPEPNPSPALASTQDTAGIDQIGAATTPEPAPAPAEPKRKRSHRGRPRSTRTIAINPSPEPGINDNRKRRPGRPNVTDDNDWLPPDWVVRTETRQNGATAGRKDKYYISPEGRRFRSRIAAENYINRSTTEVVGNNYYLRTRKA